MQQESSTFLKSRQFALRIVKLYKFLCEEKREYVLSKQLLRAGTSIGANLAESKRAITRKDFLNKVYIALKESEETRYWLDLLRDADYLSEAEYRSIIASCDEIQRMLVATTKTIEEGLRHE